jgi:hypothetical protein
MMGWCVDGLLYSPASEDRSRKLINKLKGANKAEERIMFHE